MIDPDEVAELKAQVRHDRRRQQADMVDPRDPDYDGPDPDDDADGS